MIRSRRIRFSGTTALACLAAAAPAFAQEEGVFIDPKSPSAKEYALPIESARRQADPSTSSSERVERGAAAPPLFGEGIGESAGSEGEADAGAAGSRSGSGSDSGSDGGSGSGASTGARPSRSSSDVTAAALPSSRPGTPEGGLSLLVVGAALLVLITGGVAGLLLRRRSSV